jgi:hypothetical protein
MQGLGQARKKNGKHSGDAPEQNELTLPLVIDVSKPSVTSRQRRGITGSQDKHASAPGKTRLDSANPRETHARYDRTQCRRKMA